MALKQRRSEYRTRKFQNSAYRLWPRSEHSSSSDIWCCLSRWSTSQFLVYRGSARGKTWGWQYSTWIRERHYSLSLFLKWPHWSDGYTCCHVRCYHLSILRCRIGQTPTWTSTLSMADTKWPEHTFSSQIFYRPPTAGCPGNARSRNSPLRHRFRRGACSLWPIFLIVTIC